jgi:N-acetyl-1-D-myo-inositol-2-amino-2-deoxy-alpha-D-glucopyranoside deacetylase
VNGLKDGLLLVHAHPDDECFATGGLIARSVAEGRRVDLVTCTGGEEGEIHDPTLDESEAKPRLREIREQELQCSLTALRGNGPGTLELHLLGYRDSGMMGTESNQRPDAFWNAELDEATGKLVEIVRRVRPAVMVSYDANGNYGHPDHINAYRIATAAWDAAADPARYPDSGEPHEVEKLYEITFNRDRWTEMMAAMQERGIKLPWGSDEAEKTDGAETAETAETATESETGQEEEWGVPEEEITTFLDVSAWYEQKRASMDCHKTQRQDMGWVLDMPPDLAARVTSPEHFVLTKWRDREIPARCRETSVF